MEANMSVKKMIERVKMAIEQTYLTPQQMKKLDALGCLDNLEVK